MRFVSLVVALSIGAAAWAAVPKKRPEDHVRGKQLWERSCWQCHGKAFDGQGPAAEAFPNGEVPDLRGQIHRDRFDDLVKVILNGQGDMPAFATEFDKHEARRILVYIERELARDADPPEATDDDDDAPADDAPADDAPAAPAPEGGG